MIFSSFLGGAVTLGGACATPLSGIILIRFGHKKSVLFGLIILFLSWLSIMLTPYVNLLLIGRLIQGISIGCLLSATDLYIVEAVHEKFRGTMFSLLSFARYFGCAFIFAIGASEISWRLQAMICCLLTTIPPFFILLFIPTSPRYLAGKGQLEKARKALIYFRGSNFDISTEMENLEKVFSSENRNKNGFKMQFHFITRLKVLKYLIILLIVAFGTQVNGQGIVLSYAGPLLKESLPNVNPYIWSLIIACMRIVGSIIMTGLSSRFSYRKMFLIFNLFSVCALCIFGTHLYLMENTDTLLPWFIGIGSLCSLMMTTSVVTPSALLMIGEILPSNCRSLGYVISDMMFYTSYFILIYTFPKLRVVLHIYGTIWLYGFCSFVIGWIPIIFLPETKGKNLEVIQMKLFGDDV